MKKLILFFLFFSATLFSQTEKEETKTIVIELGLRWDDVEGIATKDSEVSFVYLNRDFVDTTVFLGDNNQNLSLSKLGSVISVVYTAPNTKVQGQLLVMNKKFISTNITFDPETFDPIINFVEVYHTIKTGEWKGKIDGVEQRGLNIKPVVHY